MTNFKIFLNLIKDLECPEDFKAMNDGNHMTNCDVKCKDWKCGPCDTCEDVVEECDAGFHRYYFNKILRSNL